MGAVARRRVVRRAAVVAALAVVLGTAGILAVTGTREPADALKLLSGQAWLGNSKVGTASQVDGYSGKTTGQVAVGRPGDPFEVIQRPDGAYILDLRTGVLTRVSDSTLASGASRQLPGQPGGLQVITSGGQTWVLDHASGVLQPVNPTTLAAQGPADPLGAPTGTAVVDANGNVWVPVPSTGQVIEVSTNGNLAHKVGAPGDQVQLAVTSSGVWAVDGQAGQAQSLTGPAVLTIPQTSAAMPPVVSSSTTSPYLPVLEGDQLLDINTAQPSQGSTTSPAYRGTSQIALVGNEAYLLNPDSTLLQTVNLAPLAQNPPVTVPAGSDQLVPQDGMLFVNNPNSQQAVVVSPNGTTTPVNKYNPTSNQSSAGSDNAGDVQAPTPATPPTQTPVGTTSGPSGPNDGGTGNGSPYSPPPTSPDAPSNPPTTAPTSPTTAPPAPSTTASPEAPSAPTLQPVSASGPDLTATWSAPSNPGTPAFTSYKLTVTVSSGSGKAPSPVTVAAGTTTTQIGGLSGQTRYCVTVQAVNKVGGSNLSNQECATTGDDVSSTTGPVTVSLGGVSGSNQAVTASWTAPASLGQFDTPIDHYVVTATPSSGKALTANETSTSTSPALALPLDTSYKISVQAVNKSGNASGAVTSSSFSTDSPPGKPTGLTIKAANDELDVNFDAGTKPNNNQTVAFTISDGATSKNGDSGAATFTGLTAGQSYTITVTATSPGGTATETGTGTPWGRNATGYECQSVSWTYYEIDRRSDCGNQPGYSQINLISQTPNEFVPLDESPPGSETLYTGVIGNSPFTTDSAYYALSQGAAAPAGWSYGSGSGLSAEFTVFSSSSGTGSVQWCEAYKANGSHPYYDIYPVSSAPSACLPGTTFWT